MPVVDGDGIDTRIASVAERVRRGPERGGFGSGRLIGGDGPKGDGKGDVEIFGEHDVGQFFEPPMDVRFS